MPSTRERIPVAWGEGLDRESGLLVARPNRFGDLRNWLLHGGQIRLRPGYAAAGTGEFSEVDRLVAGQAIRNEALGIVVGYDSSTERVYVYRTAPDMSLVELLGEWEHDQSSGWGPNTPRIIMAEVNGRIFMAHDEALVTRRAPTLVYDPITGDSVLNVLTANFAGTAGESGESTDAVEDAIRFRGVVRHLVYLVGWGFGTADEPRPELVRVSLPDDPTDFDPNHYFIAGDRRNAVIACGPAGTGPQGTVLNVWKRTETHAIHGYDRRSFGIRLIDSRHGIVASRAWINLEGMAIAWGEEGPRVFEGLTPSEGIELPLGLDEWEPTDLVDEGEIPYAFTQYIPLERVGMFIFGRRVYALTTRERGNWRWSYHELGFDPYGAVTLFGTSEELEAPAAIPDVIEADIEPAGTYADIPVEPRELDDLLGSETLEIWLAEAVSGSGGTSSPAAGVQQGVTDFSEFELGVGIPDGMTFVSIRDGGDTYVYEIAEDVEEGHYLEIRNSAGDPTMFDSVGIGHDGLSGVFDKGEVLGRIWLDVSENNRFMGGIGHRIFASVDNSDPARGFGLLVADPADDIRPTWGAATDSFEGAAAQDSAADHLNGVSGWVWMRARTEDDTDPLRPRVRMNVWSGSLEDEPAGWNYDQVMTNDQVGWDDATKLFGFYAHRFGAVRWRVAFLSFTTDPAHPPIEPNDVPSGDLDWFRSRSVAAQLVASQTVRVGEVGTALEQGRTYKVAARYRNGLQYSPGASNTDDPTTWPSISQAEFTTTADPPTIADATWERTGSSAENITLTIEHAAGLSAEDIKVWRKVAGAAGDPTLLDTITGPHAASIEYEDTTISGETAYQYYVSTGDNGARGDPTRVWAGPAAIPVHEYDAALGGGYVVGFSTTDATLETELWDAYDDNGGVEAHSLRATADAGATEVESGTLTNVPDPDFTFDAKLRHKETSFSTDDFGEFTTEFQVTVPGSE